MATALQQQLASIAAKSTHQLDLKAQRSQHSKSLLFEPKEAANQTFDTLFQLCYEGFRELCMLDARFSSFAQNLFSEQSKSEERTQMTARENEELDAVLRNFLGLVSGKLLLRPGLKAVEWLVRRFRVHEYNVETLLLTFLPYHANSIFATMLSILPKTLPPAFKFLQPYISALSCPPRQAILYAAINNPGFFSALNSYTLGVARNGHQSATPLGFWASITAQAINGQIDGSQSGRADVRRQREEDLLLRIVPVLQEALQIRKVPEVFLGACMIITILVTKTELEDKVLDGLMDAVAKSWSTPTIDDGLACLSVIAEERQTPRLPRSASRALLAMPDISERVLRLLSKQQAGRLHLGLALAALDEVARQQNSEHFQLIDGFFDSQGITADRRLLVLRQILAASAGDNKLLDSEECRDSFSDLLQRLSESEVGSEMVHHAAEEERVDLGDLEIRMQITLKMPDTSELLLTDGMDIDTTADLAPASRSDSTDEVLSALPESLDDTTSFLGKPSDGAFHTFYQAYMAVQQSRSGIDNFLHVPAFADQHKASNLAVLTFFTKVWSSKKSTFAKASALQAATKVLKTTSPGLDMQGLLPYAIIGLGDVNEVVRRAASEILLSIASLYNATEKGKVPSGIKVWGQQQLYGANSGDIKWLASQDAYKFLSSAIHPHLEECVLDGDQIQRLITTVINGSTQSNAHHTLSSAVDLKSSLRSSLFVYLCSHALATPILSVRVQLLSMLARVGKAGSAGRTQLLVPALQDWLALDDQTRTAMCSAEDITPADIDEHLIRGLSHRSSEEVQCLVRVGMGDLASRESTITAASRRLKQIWPSMKLPAQESISPLILDAALSSSAASVSEFRQSAALDVIRDISLPTEVLTSFLASIPDIASMQEKPPAAKRRRTSRSESARGQTISKDALQQTIRRMTLVLELVEASKPETHPDLLKNLFNVLGELQHLKTHIGSDLVYLQQMVIGSLLSIVEALKTTPNSKVDRSVLRADLIVECVRSSSSTQVHNGALLLISSLASWVPDLVLHSVMPIFTFMSTTLLRQSDDYSAHIIDQTVSQVVPPLVASLTKKNQDLVTGAAEMLLSFTAAFEHIPLNRRLRLFSHLVLALGPDQSLHAVVAMLFEKYPTDKRVPVFAAELMNVFPATTQLTAATKYLDLVSDALRPRRTVSEAVFGFSDKTPEQIEQSLQHLLVSLARLLEQRPLHSHISKSLSRDGADAEDIRTTSGTLLERSLTLANSLGKSVLLEPACALLTATCLGLLPTAHFVRSAEPLLHNEDDKLRLLVLKSLERRAVAAKASDSAAREALLAFLPKISNIIQESASVGLKHSAIACVDQIAEKYGKKDTEAVQAAAQIIASGAALASSDDSLRISSLLCLSSMVDILRDDLVPLLPACLDQALGYLQDSISTANGERLHDAVYTFLSAILEDLPWMLSSKMLHRITELTYRSAASIFSQRSTDSREQFCTLAATKIDASTFLAVLDQTFDTAVDLGYSGSYAMLSILQRIISSNTKATLAKNAQMTFSITIKAFDIRRLLSLHDEPPTEEQLQMLDDTRDGIVLAMIMKLNDGLFRPFFIRLVDWAAEGLPKKDVQGRLLRCLSLYKFMARFFESLKSIVTSYSSYVLDHAAHTLKAVTPAEGHEQALLTNMLDALTSSFKHDQDDFWQSPAHFSAIVEPLLAQLNLANAPTTREAIGIIPAITELAAAAASPEHHKELNAQLLKCMRADDALVRLAALKCEQSLTARLGEDWLALLPEMLPFISELQEDDDEVVEKETLAWIRQIEGILGESLEGMLQ